MTILQAIILGIVQGISEFLPISSSAHLVLVPFVLDWQLDEAIIFPFDVLVQLGTLIAVIIYFFRDITDIISSVLQGLKDRNILAEPSSRLGWMIVVATIPAGILGLFLKELVERAFSSPVATAGFLILTGLALLVAERLGSRKRTISEINSMDALWIGLGQAIAIFPGISRSGATITAGMIRNLNRADAARFSFLMSIPIMLVAGGLGTIDLLSVPNVMNSILLVAIGMVVASIVGYFSIHFLLRFLKKSRLDWFAGYCFLIAASVIVKHATG